MAGPVHDAGVVPDHEVADASTRGGRPGPASSPVPAGRRAGAWPSSRSIPTTCDAVAPMTRERRPERCRHTSGCSRSGFSRQRASSSGEGSGFTRRCDASKVWRTRRHSKRSFSSSVRSVVGRVGAGKLGLPAGGGDGVRTEHRGLGRDVVLRAVDVPVERPPRVRGRGALRGIEGHDVDAGMVRPARPSPRRRATWRTRSGSRRRCAVRGRPGHRTPRVPPCTAAGRASSRSRRPARPRGPRRPRCRVLGGDGHRYQPPLTLICWPVM